MDQLSHPYMSTGKTMALTRTFVSKVMSPLFNPLSRFVIAFLPKNKCLLISWLQSLSTVILESKKIKSVTVSTFSPPICHEVIFLNEWMNGLKLFSEKSPSYPCIIRHSKEKVYKIWTSSEKWWKDYLLPFV